MAKVQNSYGILSPNRAHLDLWFDDILYEVLHEIRGVIHHNCE